MKYSQAILIACVGGAALGVSANPTGPRRGFALGKTAKLAGDVGNTAQPSNSQPAMMIARAAEAAATPDSAPAGGQGAAPDAAPQAPQKKLKKKKKHHKKRSGIVSPASDATPVARDFDEDLFIRGAMKGVKAGGKAAAKAAGGSTGIGSAAGGMFGAYQSHKAAKAQAKVHAQQPPEERRDILSDFDDDLFTRGFGMKGITAGGKAASKAAGGSKGMKSAGKSMFNMFKGGNSQPDASQQAARRSVDVDEDLYSRIVIEPGTTMTTPELGGARYHVFRRNYDDELSARLFDNFRQKYREAKAARLQKEAAIAAAKADEGAVVARDGFNFYEIDELD